MEGGQIGHTQCEDGTRTARTSADRKSDGRRDWMGGREENGWSGVKWVLRYTDCVTCRRHNQACSCNYYHTHTVSHRSLRVTPGRREINDRGRERESRGWVKGQKTGEEMEDRLREKTRIRLT